MYGQCTKSSRDGHKRQISIGSTQPMSCRDATNLVYEDVHELRVVCTCECGQRARSHVSERGVRRARQRAARARALRQTVVPQRTVHVSHNHLEHL